MKTKLIRLSMLTAAIILCQGASATVAQNILQTQTQSPSSSEYQFPSRPQVDTGQGGVVREAVRPSANSTVQQTQSQTESSQAAAAKPKSPWQITSRIHLEKGTNNGYLVVQIDLDKGYHVYSLDPKGSPAPSRVAVLPSNDLRVKSKFVSDKAPLVIEKDPVFGQRIEKHTGQVKFFAPIEVRAGVDLQKLAQEVQFSGQICSDSACQPIRKHTSSAKFAGYFEIPKTGSNATQNQQQLK